MAASAKKVYNKKHIARAELERRQRNWIIGITVGSVLLVIAMLGYGYLQKNVFLKNKAVASVNGEKISLEQFQKRVRYNRSRLINQYQQGLQILQLFGNDPSSPITQQYQAQLQQILSQLNSPTSIGQQTLNQMTDELIIRQKAEEMGITVTDEEVEQFLQEQFGYTPEGAPTPTAFPTPWATSTLSPEQLALVTPVPTPTLPPTPTPDPNAAPTEIPAPTATATPYTLEAYQSEYQTFLDNLTPLGMGDADIHALVRAQLYYQKLYDAITGDVATTQEQVWARHILISDETIANQVYDQLQNGADWNELAAQYSEDPGSKDQGGDLGWFGRGTMVPEFENVAFAIAIGQISKPVKTSFGWHIIQVLGHETRPIDQQTRESVRQQNFSDWMTEQRATADIQTFNNVWQNNTPSDPVLPQQ
ncbi:MAG: hypothetical protein Fur0018_10640 [Anaerolineales bacterium]